MNGNSNGMERSRVELALFGGAFFGLVVGAAGVVLTSVGTAVIGLGIVAAALGMFLLRQFLGE